MICRNLVGVFQRCSYTNISHALFRGFSKDTSRPKSAAVQRIEKAIEDSKKSMQWRTPISERDGVWKSKFKLFGDPEQNSDFITMMQQPIDLRPSTLKKWWTKRKERKERFMQQYIPERNEILGADLAAAHFILFRDGSVKFHHETDWRKGYSMENDLPSAYHGGFKIEAIRCDNMLLYYEGLDNLRRLENLKFLSFRNVKTFDDWCLDRVSGLRCPKLEVLDISETNCTFRGLCCLYRILSLRKLVIDDPKQSIELELMCSNLEEANPKLTISAARDVHNL